MKHGARLNVKFIGRRNDNIKCEKCVVCEKALRRKLYKTGLCSKCYIQEMSKNVGSQGVYRKK